jgi:hypothetical protein
MGNSSPKASRRLSRNRRFTSSRLRDFGARPASGLARGGRHHGQIIHLPQFFVVAQARLDSRILVKLRAGLPEGPRVFGNERLGGLEAARP